jgi:hypothetical protein
MANRYWVGGAGTWTNTNSVNWSATSGGFGGASVPTTADDVFFDANSNGASAFSVTIGTGNLGAKSINCTGFTRAIIGSAPITVAGSVTLSTGMTWSHTGVMTITGTGTLTTAGKAFSAVQIAGAGITVTLGGALNIAARIITVTNGTFNTAGFAVTAGGLQSTATANNRQIILGASTLSLSASGTTAFSTQPTNLTFNAGTSQINFTSATPNLSAGPFNATGLTFHNVSMTSAIGGSRTITGINTFNNLTLNAAATASLTQLQLLSNQTINGTFTANGSSPINRAFIRAEPPFTPRTITAAAISVSNIDFRDITIAGAAAPISPTGAGNCGGNSGITFPAAKTVYRVGTNTTWAGSNSWATTSGGTGSNNNFPLAQDTAIIDNNTALTGTLAVSFFNIPTLNCSSRTNAITINQAAVPIYGSYILGSGVTVSGTGQLDFLGSGTMNFTSSGKTITFPMQIQCRDSGSFNFTDAFNSTNSITIAQGVFNTGGFNVTCTIISSSVTTARTINLSSSVITLVAASGTPWQTAGITNLTFNSGTSNIIFVNNTSNTQTFNSGALSFNKLTIAGTGNFGVTNITGTPSFNELTSTKTVAHNIVFSTNIGTINTWNVKGVLGQRVTLRSSIPGTRRTFSLTNMTTEDIDYLEVRDIQVVEPNRFFVGLNSINNGNNINVYFSLPGVATSNFFMFFI